MGESAIFNWCLSTAIIVTIALVLFLIDNKLAFVTSKSRVNFAQSDINVVRTPVKDHLQHHQNRNRSGKDKISVIRHLNKSWFDLTYIYKSYLYKKNSHIFLHCALNFDQHKWCYIVLSINNAFITLCVFHLINVKFVYIIIKMSILRNVRLTKSYLYIKVFTYFYPVVLVKVIDVYCAYILCVFWSFYSI